MSKDDSADIKDIELSKSRERERERERTKVREFKGYIHIHIKADKIKLYTSSRNTMTNPFIKCKEKRSC